MPADQRHTVCRSWYPAESSTNASSPSTVHSRAPTRTCPRRDRRLLARPDPRAAARRDHLHAFGPRRARGPCSRLRRSTRARPGESSTPPRPARVRSWRRAVRQRHRPPALGHPGHARVADADHQVRAGRAPRSASASAGAPLGAAACAPEGAAVRATRTSGPRTGKRSTGASTLQIDWSVNRGGGLFLRAAAVQLNSTDDKDRNLAAADRLDRAPPRPMARRSSCCPRSSTSSAPHEDYLAGAETLDGPDRRLGARPGARARHRPRGRLHRRAPRGPATSSPTPRCTWAPTAS